MKTDNLSPKTKKQLKSILSGGIAESTRRAYAGDMQYIGAWHQARYGHKLALPMPVSKVQNFILDHINGPPKKVDQRLISQKAKRAPGPVKHGTLKRRLMTLSVVHSEAGHRNPISDSGIRLLMRRAARANETPKRRKQAATADIVGQLLATCDGTLHGIRDAAIIAVGFSAGGRRRSELAGLRAEHLSRTRDGYQWRIPKSKTDQTGRGHTVPITGQAARLLKQWLVKSGIRKGHVFRGIKPNDTLLNEFTGQGIARMIRRRAEQAGLDHEQFGGHSLRAGFITEGGRWGAFIGDLMALSGHKSIAVALDYYRTGGNELCLGQDYLEMEAR